jgi:broad specificity phosphatase PhoE
MERNDGTEGDDLERVSEEVAGRLATLGIELTGRETPDEVTRIADAVERYEAAVESRGGDLMMDEPPPGSPPQPDDPHFALPSRNTGESVTSYLARLERVTDEVLRHRRDG